MKGILLAATLENFTTRKDNTIKVTMGTQELSPEKAGLLFSLHNKLATVYISPSEIDSDELTLVDQVDPELGGKTQGQRLRNTLYVLFTKQAEGYNDFDGYYHFKTEQIIKHLQDKLDKLNG